MPTILDGWSNTLLKIKSTGTPHLFLMALIPDPLFSSGVLICGLTAVRRNPIIRRLLCNARMIFNQTEHTPAHREHKKLLTGCLIFLPMTTWLVPGFLKILLHIAWSVPHPIFINLLSIFFLTHSKNRFKSMQILSEPLNSPPYPAL